MAGDSAGGNLVLALLQLILYLNSKSADGPAKVLFNGSWVALHLPAGFSALSAYGDITLGLPSWFENAKSDLFNDSSPYMRPDYPRCELWPQNPPRAQIYCQDSAMCHPLVSPTLAESWAGPPPIWLSCGEERLADSSKIVAHRAAEQGVVVVVVWEQYEALPHCFCAIPVLSFLPQADMCLKS